jgi:hypothetical protein
MFRRSITALALVSALTGCVAAPPKGPLVEYRDGITPVTRPVKCEATYALRSADRPDPLTAHHVERGERLGFRREADGSVTAVAPGHLLPLAPGAYTWEVVPGSVAPWRTRFGAEVSPAVLGALFLAGVTAAFGALLYLGSKLPSGDDDDCDSQTNSPSQENNTPAKPAAKAPYKVP